MAKAGGGRKKAADRAASVAQAPNGPAALGLSESARPGGDATAVAGTPVYDLRGYIDEVSDSWIKGWVWDPQRPQQRFALDLCEGDVRLCRVTASQQRSDLREAGIGDGGYAFSIPLDERLAPGIRHVLNLRVADSEIEVPGSPIVVEPAVPDSDPFADIGGRPADGQFDQYDAPPIAGAAAVDPASAGAAPADLAASGAESGEWLALQSPDAAPLAAGDDVLQCNIDLANRTAIRGWVWNPSRPQQRIALELLDGETPLATVLASDYREDLEQAGIGDGRHGFSFSFGETLLPYARHVLHLRPVGTTVELPSFPRVLTREDAGLDPTIQFILGNIAAEAERAGTTEELAPLVTSLLRFVDAALMRYFEIVDDTETEAVDLVDARQLSPQFQDLIKSIQFAYPPLNLETDGRPLVSIVIPVFNKFELTYNCVKSIIEHGAKLPFEIIVVDDCSRDETMLAGMAFGRGIRLIRNDKNCGFILTCNRGFDAARGEYVVFLNNDTEVKAGWLDELYETMQRDPKIGIVGAKLLFPDGTVQECGGIVWRMGDAWNWGRGRPADDPRFCYQRDADYVSGAALMIRASLFAELGKFDEHFLPAYYEDTDLCFRARRAGHRVVVQPVAAVVHFEGASAGTSVTGTGMKRFQAINHRKFFARWQDTLARHRFNGELPELEAERDVRQRALFIDDSVPEPDKDAGSNAAFQHMLSLQRLGYKVTFIPADNMARIDPYTTDLQRRGIECLYHPYYTSVEDACKQQAVAFDVVYLHRYSNASKYAGMLRQRFPDARILYNVADLHFLRVAREAEVQHDAKLRERAEQLRRLELGAMSFADCVIVHSDAEAKLLHEIAPDVAVEVIAWTVPLRDLEKKSGEQPQIAFIGGYRHTPNVDAAVWTAQSLMPILRGSVPGIELLLVGSNMPAEVSALAAKDIVPVGFVPALDSVLERVRLTVAPLRFGAGLKGKVIDSLAAGIPCVMTSIAAEGIDLPADLKSLVADEPQELAGCIASLCRDDGEYRRVVEAGRAFVAANYSPDRIDAQLLAACALS